MNIPGKIVQRGGVLWYDGYLHAETVGAIRLRPERLRATLLTADPAVASTRAEELYQRLTEERRQRALEEQALTVDSFFTKRFVVEYVRQRRDPQGVILIQQRYRDYIAPVIGSMSLDQVTPADLRRVRARAEERRRPRTERTLSTTTVRHIVADLRTLFRYAAEEARLIHRTPWVPSLMPRPAEKKRMPLTGEQIRKILAAARPHEGFVIRLALLTGMRWGELRTLHRSDYHLEPVPHLVLRRENTKSRRERVVALLPEAREILDAHLAHSTDLMVSPLRAKNACWFTQRLSAVVGFHWHFHQTRHTFDTRAQLAGFSPGWVGAMAGQTPATVGRYTTVVVQQLAAEIERVYRAHDADRGHNLLTEDVVATG